MLNLSCLSRGGGAGFEFDRNGGIFEFSTHMRTPNLLVWASTSRSYRSPTEVRLMIQETLVPPQNRGISDVIHQNVLEKEKTWML